MSRHTYILTIITVCAFAGSIALLLAGGYWQNGEVAVGASFIWLVSVPAALILGVLLGYLTHGTYLQLNGTGRQISFLLRLGLLLAVIAPLATFGCLALYQAVVA